MPLIWQYPASFDPLLGQIQAMPPGLQRHFLLRMYPVAERVSEATGVSRRLLLAQWAEESGWGTSAAAVLNNNFAGIKPFGRFAAGPDPTYAGFSSLDQFARGDIAFLEQPRYLGLRTAARAGASPAQQAALLAGAGYATDPSYYAHVLAVFRSTFGSPGPGPAVDPNVYANAAPSSAAASTVVGNLLQTMWSWEGTGNPFKWVTFKFAFVVLALALIVIGLLGLISIGRNNLE